MSTANQHKEIGNRYFSQEKYEDAIKEYSTAIDPNIPIFFTNRALCYIKLESYEQAIADARKAIELDSSNLKGYYFLGQALLETNRYEESFKNLCTALKIAIEQKATFVESVSKLCFESRAKMKRIAASKVNKFYSYLLDTAPDEFRALIDRHSNALPDCFFDPISFEIMLDPVITPSGKTYDRCSIHTHLERIGKFDPLTRKPMSYEDLIPNYALKDAIEHYLQLYPEAIDQ